MRYSDNGECLVETYEDVAQVLKEIAFAPSCLDMGWRWEIATSANHPLDPKARLLDETGPAGWLIRCSFQRPDRETGLVGRGFGRWWFIDYGVTESGLVKTAFAAAKLNVEHEMLEAFHYRGVRLFDPHHTVDELGAAAEAKCFRGRR